LNKYGTINELLVMIYNQTLPMTSDKVADISVLPTEYVNTVEESLMEYWPQRTK